MTGSDQGGGRSRRLVRRVVVAAVFLGAVALIPSRWAGREAAGWERGDLATQLRLARTVQRQIEAGLASGDFLTGSDRYSGEWLFGTYLMAGIGLCQIALQHPAAAPELSPTIDRCVRELLSPRVRAFDEAAWKSDALATLDGPNGHAAYLGYLNLLLALYARIEPANPFIPLHREITTALLRRLRESPNGLVATYPGEWYPVDNAPILASLALSADVDRAVLNEVLATYRARCVDARTGLLLQAFTAEGRAADQPRGSGTTLAAFFLAHGLRPLALELYAATRRELSVDVVGFGAIREYPRGADGTGDIDSGPIIFGFGFSATGFALGGARMAGDTDWFRRLFASAWLAGAPVRRGTDLDFLTAGPLGNAILLAMLTAPVSP